ncbi:MAG: hypothetical protein FWF77_08790 [Defluviitaleaceae bacterium]|nr:hypothetical protein [Defluviitaleaceae bacterium]
MNWILRKNSSKTARQARIGHRGHVSAATHSLEAGSSFPNLINFSNSQKAGF